MDGRILAGGVALGLMLAGAAAAQAVYCADCAAQRIAACGGFLEGVNVDAEGVVWVVDITGDRILTIAPGSDECVLRGRGGGRPNGARFAPDGALLLADGAGIMRFDPADGSVSALVTHFEGEPLAELNDLAVDAQGGVYFTAPAGSDLANPAGRVFYLPPGESAPVLFAQGHAYPNGLALAPGGQVLLAEFAAKRIVSLTAHGARGVLSAHVHAYTTGGIGPDGMAVGPDGRLYAAIFGAGKVSVFAPDGAPLGDIGLPDGAGTFTTNVAVRDGALYVTEAQRGEVWRIVLPE